MFIERQQHSVDGGILDFISFHVVRQIIGNKLKYVFQAPINLKQGINVFGRKTLVFTPILTSISFTSSGSSASGIIIMSGINPSAPRRAPAALATVSGDLAPHSLPESNRCFWSGTLISSKFAASYRWPELHDRLLLCTGPRWSRI